MSLVTESVEQANDSTQSVESQVTENQTVEQANESQPTEQPATEGTEGNAEPTEKSSTEGQAPESYDEFKVAEGITIDDKLLSEAAPLFKELGLNQEQAQKLVDFQAKQVQANSESQTESFNKLMDDWQNQSRNDKEFGGDAFEENIGIARTAIDKFGTPELKQLLEEHGVGNHPEVIRFMVKVGKTTMEDVPGSTSSAPVSKAQDRVSQLYPNDRNNT